MQNLDNPSHDREVGVADATQDTTRIDDVRIGAVRPLISPALLQDELPVPQATQTLVEDTRKAIGDILHGRDDRLLLVVGPCSIHDHDQALDYARRLKAAADTLKDELLITMRVYFEKPRTTVGWKGYINDPRLDGSFRINEGLRAARHLLLDINALGLPAATEFLDLLSPQYIADLIAWGAIGARTTESQSHRQLASGLSCPIGFKNGTDGGVQVASDAIVAAASRHAFMGMTKMGMAAIFETRGNDDAHVILRGGKNGPNYDAEHVEACCAVLRKAGLREQVMVDCSHANSNKSHERQIEVAQDLAGQLARGEQRIVGVMVESHLEAGRQDLKPGVPLKRGVSITDACLSWAQTEPVLEVLADAVRQRRAHSRQA
ncbi:3-deoxy-7-phosphoheptulonate synthase [Burkholderia gladioli]|uniref:Phospho-2-dehydro-3-deoxyheptonate aldolase n=1 Tax=Burkholderia gladioli TaxID=28095 RepID=A0AB38U2J8_BURGA|nr:3-deoxy-7-phosphoheptulonate synthase [Burkholderia gladioli]KAF1058400.1 Phospho-2-dehydro-3-deoxyheptonate aldolase, Phe-sensitive [Burkholderia gladioli]PRH36961.1 3-deoxy-7-phosphoheptulonate synthase [Burkholderia gladioli]URV28800.1 3-deoxy-7-phosphoheptulonate synthase [Burkholderia gladioli]UWX74210.1 3-deoxy-7-phosphoheptulonate synthase [Burkholderia gladioli]WAG22590.1 3-deoxy-7-phosphoheptulonate synthase [Burkholderia gladioli]